MAEDDGYLLHHVRVEESEGTEGEFPQPGSYQGGQIARKPGCDRLLHKPVEGDRHAELLLTPGFNFNQKATTFAPVSMPSPPGKWGVSTEQVCRHTREDGWKHISISIKIKLRIYQRIIRKFDTELSLPVVAQQRVYVIGDDC
ncbi:Hypothetical predicted protein [Xyrichtys novacula]|uniref:Uncharacterized protein n=1 Tax=Xyrichtys novacula TaxID=13765 RepID=A0AAV1EI83_XYRNO|nr:Hypothetical predicted protein [Xyrichtys novacula]